MKYCRFFSDDYLKELDQDSSSIVEAVKLKNIFPLKFFSLVFKILLMLIVIKNFPSNSNLIFKIEQKKLKNF